MYETITYEHVGQVATITLDRPEVLNAYDDRMCAEFREVWERVRTTDDVHAVVLRAAGERAFSTGIDVSNEPYLGSTLWGELDPARFLGPRTAKVWKPVIAAVHGMAAGGAFYWLNECDVIVASDDATFFDPHTTYGLTSALEPMGMLSRMPLGEVLRIALFGLDERVSARRMLEVGFVTEVVPRAELWGRAHELASILARKPPAAVQGTVKAIWEGLDMTRSQRQEVGFMYTQLGVAAGGPVDRGAVERPTWRLR